MPTGNMIAHDAMRCMPFILYDGIQLDLASDHSRS